MKVLIFDSGPLINFSMNGILDLLEGLKKDFDGKFVITHDVKREVYDRPLKIKEFALGALRIKDLIDRGILELPESLDVSLEKIQRETQKILETVNHTLKANDEWIKIMSEGETSCLALSTELTKRKIQNMIAVDERTARVICEKPESLEALLSKRVNKKVTLVSEKMKECANYEFIRSPELVYVAYKKGLTKLKGKEVLDALLYATKFKGSSISFEEIEEIKKINL